MSLETNLSVDLKSSERDYPELQKTGRLEELLKINMRLLENLTVIGDHQYEIPVSTANELFVVSLSK